MKTNFVFVRVDWGLEADPPGLEIGAPVRGWFCIAQESFRRVRYGGRPI